MRLVRDDAGPGENEHDAVELRPQSRRMTAGCSSPAAKGWSSATPTKRSTHTSGTAASSGLGLDRAQPRSTRSCSLSAPTARTPSSSPATCWCPGRKRRRREGYDARAEGGYCRAAKAAPCAASDECHGPGTPPPPPPTSTRSPGPGTPPGRPRRRQRSRSRRSERRASSRSARGARGSTTGMCVATGGNGSPWGNRRPARRGPTMSTQPQAARSSRPRRHAGRRSPSLPRWPRRDLRRARRGRPRNRLLRSHASGTPRPAAPGHQDQLHAAHPANRKSPKTIETKWPEGVFGNPRSRPTLQQHRFRPNQCASFTQIGWVSIRGYWEGNPFHVFGAAPLYDMEPSATETARFAFTVPGSISRSTFRSRSARSRTTA